MLQEFLFSAEAASQGFILTISIILAVGLQNTYILRQGVLGRHVFAAALTCTVSDYILIILGSMGLGKFFSSNDMLRQGALIGGVLFLLYYALHSWVRAYRGKESSTAIDGDPDVASLSRTIIMAMAFTFLNPLALMETMIIVGGYSTKFIDFDERASYTLGAMAAVTVWFFTLAYLAKLLRPLFIKPLTGRILDVFVGVLMFSIAMSLLYSEFLAKVQS